LSASLDSFKNTKEWAEFSDVGVPEASLEKLTLLLDWLAREYAKTNDEYQRADIAAKIWELTARILTIRCRPPDFFMTK